MNRAEDRHLRRRLVAERLFAWTCRAATLAAVVVLAILLVEIARQGLSGLNWDFLTSLPSRRAATAGVKPALFGTVWVVIGTAILAVPVGIAAAVYLEEFAEDTPLNRAIEINISNLAGVPSIIYGMLGLGLFVRWMALGETVIAGALTLALLVLPVVIMSSREALRTVKDSLREAALGLGATRWQTTRHVVLPMAIPGILTGAILAISRAIGETAPLVVVGAVAFILYAPDGLDAEYTALPMQIFQWTSNPRREFLTNAAAGIVVLMFTLFLLNSIAILLRNRFQKRMY